MNHPPDITSRVCTMSNGPVKRNLNLLPIVPIIDDGGFDTEIFRSEAIKCKERIILPFNSSTYNNHFRFYNKYFKVAVIYFGKTQLLFFQK